MVLAWWQLDCLWGMWNSLHLVSLSVVWLTDLYIDWETPHMQGMALVTGISTICERLLTVPLYSPNNRQMPAIRAVQEDCERVFMKTYAEKLLNLWNGNFLHFCPPMRGNHVNSPHKKSVMWSFNIFFVVSLSKLVEQTVVLPVIWSTIDKHVTSLQCLCTKRWRKSLCVPRQGFLSRRI